MSSPVAPSPWKRSYDDVKMHIPGLTDAVFKQMLYHVMNDFFALTNVWVEEVPIVVQPNVVTYPFSVTRKGDPKRLILLYDSALPHPDRHWVQGGASMAKPGVLNLSYAPSSIATWNAVIAKVLGEPTTTDNYPDMLPEDHWIVDQYGDGIIYGILGRLMSMPSKPFTNAKLAGQYWQTYVTERGRARTDVVKANVYGGQRWMYPQSFSTAHRKGWV